MKFLLFILQFIILSALPLSNASNDPIRLDPIVPTTSGKLIGQRSTINNNGEIYQFFGVPYAQAPIGENRFEKPKELLSNASEQFVVAKHLKSTCMQMKHLAKAINPLLDFDQIHNISEDCLYLNIYVPIVDHQQPLPVMVWLPGEGYDFADARQFDGSYLASIGKVIVVTVQYRVGVFGFLKNNAGLWDQLAALKWINKNIANFGGNPQDVTVFGRFSGSMSISILLSSPQIENPEPLFNRAILMSGIAVGHWVFDNKHEEKMQQVVEIQNCNDVECLKTLPAEQILEKSGHGWKPFLDSDLIDDEPLDAIRKGKFSKNVESIMLGSNQFEGNLCLIKHLALDKIFYGQLIRNNISQKEFERIVREDLQMFYGDDYHFENYRASGIITDRDNYMQFCSELLIDSHMREYDALLQQIYYSDNYRLRNIYKYKVDYKPSFSIAPEFINSSIHGDDVLLAFGLAFKNPYTSNASDRKISNQMIELFSQFASNGAPRYLSSNHYIEIRAEMKRLSSKHNHCFWRQWSQDSILFTLFFAIFTIFIVMVFILSRILLESFKGKMCKKSCEHIKRLINENC